MLRKQTLRRYLREHDLEGYFWWLHQRAWQSLLGIVVDIDARIYIRQIDHGACMRKSLTPWQSETLWSSALSLSALQCVSQLPYLQQRRLSGNAHSLQLQSLLSFGRVRNVEGRVLCFSSLVLGSLPKCLFRLCCCLWASCFTDDLWLA